MEKETKIAFIGEKGCIEFFGAFGADVFSVSSQQQAYEILEKIYPSDYGVIFITEDFFNIELFKRYVMEKKVVVIPSFKSKENKGYQILDELIRKATGMKG